MASLQLPPLLGLLWGSQVGEVRYQIQRQPLQTPYNMQFDVEDGSAGLDGIGGDRSSVAWTPGELVGRKSELTR